MAFGVETRHPFLDVDLVNFGYQLPDEFKIRDGWQKWIVRKNMTNVPDAIRFRKDKKGYTIPQKKFKETYRKDLMKYQSYVSDFDSALTDSAFSFRLSALGIWLHQNNSISGQK